MKKTVIILSALVLAASCSKFLGETPSSFVNRGSYYKTETQCLTAVNSCYEGLRSVYSSTLWTHLEGTTDLVMVPSISDVNAILDINPSQCNISKTVWSASYKAIMYCNAAIAGVSASTTIDGARKLELLAEAKIMRAHWYWLLTGLFGDVPFYTEDVVDQPTMDRIARLGRMSAVDTRSYLVEELEKCCGDLPKTRACDMGEKGRAGWAMGMMLIAKMSLWNAYLDTDGGTDWVQKATDALEALAGVYGELSQYPLSDIPFSVKDTPESIFEIRHTYSEGTLSYASNLATMTMPSYNASTDLYDGISVPVLGNEAKVGTCSRPTAYFYQVIQPDDGKDLRVDINQGRRYNGTAFANGLKRPWMGPKFWCPHMKTTYDSNNYTIFRYADALLMLAECYALKEDSTHFELYMNEVRSRAGLPAVSYIKQSRAMQEMRDERARELFGEFGRKFDLVRWGIWYDALKDFWEPEMNARGYNTRMRRCHRYLPIPNEQVVNSGYALDNKEYNEYGL